MAGGIPSLLRPAARVTNIAGLLVADGLLLVHQFANSERWGIYLKDKLVIAADSMRDIEYRQGSKISDYPQEEGAFQSYNKVATPFEIRVSLTKGGNQRERAAFLSAVEKASASLEIYDVVTPEKTYTSVNIEGYGLRRAADSGVGLITVEIGLVQVRNTARSAFTNTSQPSGAAPQNVGAVQAQTPTTGVSNAVGPVIVYPVRDQAEIKSVGIR
jgi:hypothetical protein